LKSGYFLDKPRPPFAPSIFKLAKSDGEHPPCRAWSSRARQGNSKAGRFLQNCPPKWLIAGRDRLSSVLIGTFGATSTTTPVGALLHARAPLGWFQIDKPDCNVPSVNNLDFRPEGHLTCYQKTIAHQVWGCPDRDLGPSATEFLDSYIFWPTGLRTGRQLLQSSCRHIKFCVGLGERPELIRDWGLRARPSSRKPADTLPQKTGPMLAMLISPEKVILIYKLFRYSIARHFISFKKNALTVDYS